MTSEPSLAVRLFGTDEPVTPPQMLRAGQLTAELEAGNLRYIRYAGRELLRAVSFIVRDRNWGTYNPRISNLSVEESGGGFKITYDAIARDDAQEFRYSAEITGSAEGRLIFRGRGRAVTDFLTNRTGFVVLHPVEGVAGRPVRIEHVDGSVVESEFPRLIDPVQPMMELRALTHDAAPGLAVTCRMEGDTFEMEDQRNWTDASYKTYVRPLAMPWPYTLPAGTETDQSVTVEVTGQPAAGAVESGGEIVVRLGPVDGEVPALGIGLDPDEAEAALENIGMLRELRPAHLVCHYDPRRGHGRAELDRAFAVANGLGAVPWLEAVIQNVEGFEEEIAALGKFVREIGSPFPVVLVSPAPDLKCTLPGSPWPPCPPATDLFQAARGAFPDARLGGGMFSYFTELNRKRPPAELLDFVSFTTSAMVHAGDDRSVTETLEALPSIAASVQVIAGGKPYAVGPSAMGMRGNPYGAAPMENPQNIRQAMSRNDPRQRGLLGAAWNLGFFSRFAYGGAMAVTLGGLVGPFGLISTAAEWSQPWYDENGGLYPAFHVVRGLAALRDRRLRHLDISAPGQVQGFAVEADGGTEIWLANLTAQPQQITLPSGSSAAFLLDSDSFVAASRNPSAVDRLSYDIADDRLTLQAYAVARLRAQ